MAALGMPDFGPAFSVSCDNHGGPAVARCSSGMPTARPGSILTDWIESDDRVIDPLIAEDSAAYAAEAGDRARCN